MSSSEATSKPASTDEWRDIAQVPNLLYHILSWPDKKDGWTEEDFYAAGVSDWADFRRAWQQYGSDLTGTCVEIGCGAGRITTPMAADFDRVIALDVSEEMLSRTAAVAPSNVEPVQVDGTSIPAPDGSVDAVFSVIVLQHLETFEDVQNYLRDAHRAIRPGGSIMINLTLALSEERGALRRLKGELGIRRSRRGLKKGRVHEYVRWRQYPWEDILLSLREIGFEQIELKMFPVSSNGEQHQFWFARRPA